ncbi:MULTISPECIES: GtrA family protein [unclassified Vibrio]|uniref:GtrA family protein n=1 Tax=unclassified Vibrio TaxID=2614977 RepID=UPI003550B3AC
MRILESYMNKQLINRVIGNRLIKFLTVGAVNTIVSYVTFMMLIEFVNYNVSYSVSYCIGIVTSYILNGSWTFNKSLSIRGLITYPVVYLAQFFSGWVILKVAVEVYKFTESEAYIASMLVSIPVGFLASKLYFKDRN